MITVKSYPNLEIDYSIDDEDYLESTHSNGAVQNVWVNISEAPTDEYIEIVYNGVTTTLLITEECRYTPIDTAFQAKSESLSVTNEEFESDRGQPQDGNHQYVRFNVQAREKFKVNSGFVKEVMNETFKQLLLSERVWMLEDDVYTPLNVASKTLEYKTRQKERLINYEIEFDFAFNEINNV